MTREVDEKLHSNAPVVMIEAAGGCGKTTKAAKFARESAERLTAGKVLLLSHTHAACGEFQRKCAKLNKKIDVETCDSFCLKVIGAYARPLGLPSPIESHLDRPGGGISFAALSEKAAELFRRAPTVARVVATHYPVIVLDEHQDASLHQHEVVRLLREIGEARLRIFGDPMQAIHPASDNGHVDWDALWAAADETGKLEEAHRWAEVPDLGEDHGKPGCAESGEAGASARCPPLRKRKLAQCSGGPDAISGRANRKPGGAWIPEQRTE